MKCKKGYKLKGNKCISSKKSKILNFVPRRFPPIIVYILGAGLEVVGFGLLFAFDKTMSLIHKFPIPFSLFVIISGFVIAVSARRK